MKKITSHKLITVSYGLILVLKVNKVKTNSLLRIHTKARVLLINQSTSNILNQYLKRKTKRCTPLLKAPTISIPRTLLKAIHNQGKTAIQVRMTSSLLTIKHPFGLQTSSLKKNRLFQLIIQLTLLRLRNSNQNKSYNRDKNGQKKTLTGRKIILKQNLLKRERQFLKVRDKMLPLSVPRVYKIRVVIQYLKHREIALLPMITETAIYLIYY